MGKVRVLAMPSDMGEVEADRRLMRLILHLKSIADKNGIDLSAPIPYPPHQEGLHNGN
jgi:hypothetical protein